MSDLIIIRTFQNYFSAHILLTKLKSAGIECYLKDEFTVTIDPFLSNAIGGIKLVVRKENGQEALSLLNEFDEEFRSNAVCPQCGSHEIERIPKRSTANLLAAILSWFFGDYAISAKNIYQCAHCKYESATLPETFPDNSWVYEQEEEMNLKNAKNN